MAKTRETLHVVARKNENNIAIEMSRHGDSSGGAMA